MTAMNYPMRPHSESLRTGNRRYTPGDMRGESLPKQSKHITIQQSHYHQGSCKAQGL